LIICFEIYKYDKTPNKEKCLSKIDELEISITEEQYNDAINENYSIPHEVRIAINEKYPGWHILMCWPKTRNLNMKENRAINQSPDYLRGLADGYKEGFNAALEQMHCLQQQHSMRIEMSAEKLEELKMEICKIPMPIGVSEELNSIMWYDNKDLWEE